VKQFGAMPAAAGTKLIVAKMRGGGCGVAGGQWVMLKNVTG
jgi:hypothetical protein